MIRRFISIKHILKQLTCALDKPTPDIEIYLKVWIVRYNLKNTSQQIYLHTRNHGADINYLPDKPGDNSLDDILGHSMWSYDDLDFNPKDNKNTGLLNIDLQALFKALKNDLPYYCETNGHYLQHRISINNAQFEKINSILKIKNASKQGQREEYLKGFLYTYFSIIPENFTITKAQLWELLSEVDNSIFRPLSKDAIDDFFGKQKVFNNFKAGRPSKGDIYIFSKIKCELQKKIR